MFPFRVRCWCGSWSPVTWLSAPCACLQPCWRPPSQPWLCILMAASSLGTSRAGSGDCRCDTAVGTLQRQDRTNRVASNQDCIEGCLLYPQVVGICRLSDVDTRMTVTCGRTQTYMPVYAPVDTLRQTCQCVLSQYLKRKGQRVPFCGKHAASGLGVWLFCGAYHGSYMNLLSCCTVGVLLHLSNAPDHG